MLTINEIKATVSKVGKKYGIKNAYLFGSYARGEANESSDVFKMSHPEVGWNKIVGFRNIIAHDYGSVDEWLAWTIISKDIPTLRDFCVAVLK